MDFKELSDALAAALVSVKAKKEIADKAAKDAAADAAEYQKAIQTAQKARQAYDAHVNEAMSGFANIHQ